MNLIGEIEITPGGAVLNGNEISTKGITGLYREFAGDYPKFFKMDNLCRLGFVAAELLLKEIPAEEKENCAVVLFNESASLITDRNYEDTISDADNYFPSPALFVYTLANIVAGEIAIRHKIYGETAFYVTDRRDENYMEAIAADTALTSNPSMILYGWVEYKTDEDYTASLKLLRNNK